MLVKLGRSAVAALVVSMAVARGAVGTPNDSSAVREQLRALKVERTTTRPRTWYSHGTKAHALRVQSILRQALRFYAKRFGLTIELEAAVLTSSDWEKISARAPFPVPFVSRRPFVAVVPATLKGTFADSQTPLPRISPAAARELKKLGASPDKFREVDYDAIVLHELGHLYTEQYGIATPRRWLSEFLATYWWNTLWNHEFPGLAAYSAAVTDSDRRSGSVFPPHTTLADLERLSGPPAISPENYDWYQTRLGERVRQVYATEGAGFLIKMKGAFPASTPTDIADDEIADRLESVSPGWREWLDQFGK